MNLFSTKGHESENYSIEYSHKDLQISINSFEIMLLFIFSDLYKVFNFRFYFFLVLVYWHFILLLQWRTRQKCIFRLKCGFGTDCGMFKNNIYSTIIRHWTNLLDFTRNMCTHHYTLSFFALFERPEGWSSLKPDRFIRSTQTPRQLLHENVTNLWGSGSIKIDGSPREL